MEDGLNPLYVEARLNDVLEGLFDGPLNVVGIVHGNALKSNAEDCVTSTRFVAYNGRKKRNIFCYNPNKTKRNAKFCFYVFNYLLVGLF